MKPSVNASLQYRYPISVILAYCNEDKYFFLKEAIDSVLQQTFKNFELILIADGPIQNPNILTTLNKIKDSRIKYLTLEVNKGPAAARNYGIQHAQGEYIAIMDADDICEPNRFEAQLDYIKQTQADLIGSNYFIINEQGEIIRERKVPKDTQTIIRWIPFFNPMNNPTVFAKSNVLKQYPYNECLRFGEDYELWIRLAKAGFNIQNIELNLLRFRLASNFYLKRRGFKLAISDLKNKLYAKELVPLPMYPLYILALISSVLIRVVPSSLLKWLYRIKAWLFH